MTLTPEKLKQHADAAERARRLWAARLAGATWAEAATAVGFSDHANAVRAVRSYFGTLPSPDRGLQRELWRQRLELLWKQVLQDVTEQRPGAVRAGVALAQRAAQMDALDEPQRVQVAVTNSALDRYPGGSLEAHLVAGGLPAEEDAAAFGIGPEEIAELRARVSSGYGDDG